MSKAFRLGLFIFTTLLAFSGGIFWIGNKQFLFSSTYRLNAEFQNVGGVGNGAAVRVGGIHQGTVKRIDLPHRPDQKVRLVMDLKAATRDVIKKDSVAAIKSEGLIGDKYVEISFGTNDAPKVSENDTIQSEPPLEISDVVKKANVLLESAQGALQNIDETSGNLKAISDKINSGSGTVGALINDRQVYQNVNEAAGAFHEDMKALRHNFLLRGFFKNRGYEDSSDLKKHSIAKLPSGPQLKHFTFDGSKLFDKPDTAKLKKGKLLNEAGEYLSVNRFSLAVIAGSTDMKGDTEKDRTLTEARAMVVRDYLVQNFKLEDTRIKTIGLGKSGDVTDGSRIDIFVYPPRVE